MEKQTKEQIDKRLKKLRESRLEDESYTVTRPEMAMCYSMSPDRFRTAYRFCAECGEMYRISWNESDGDFLSAAEGIVRKFYDVGMEGELIYRCPACAKLRNRNPYEIRLKIGNGQSCSSYPVMYNPFNRTDATSIREYELVLKFLSAPESIDLAEFFDRLYNGRFREMQTPQNRSGVSCKTEESKWTPIDFRAEKDLTLSRALALVKNRVGRGEKADISYSRFLSLFSSSFSVLTYKGLIAQETVHNFRDAGLIKTQIDRALNKVLGMVFVYDSEEVRKSIKSIWTLHGVNEFIPLAYRTLEESGKESFTLAQYDCFMERIAREIMKPIEDAIQYLEEIVRANITENRILKSRLIGIAKQWMSKQDKVGFSQSELDEYFESELIPNAKIDCETLKEILRKDDGMRSYRLYADEAREEEKAIRENFLEGARGILRELDRSQIKEFSLQEILRIQDAVNRRIASQFGRPHVNVIRSKLWKDS
ncbi:MAG: hypothetical protein ACI4ST_03190 [Candidatus Gallimonas sp.]